MKKKKNKHHHRKSQKTVTPHGTESPVVATTTETNPQTPQKRPTWQYFIVGGVIGMIIYSLIYFQGPSWSNYRHVEESARQDSPKPTQVPPTPTPTLILVTEPVYMPVLTYHYVEHDRDLRDWKRVKLTTHPEILEEQFKTLKEYGYTTYFAKDLPEILAGRMPQADRGIILTFDDGYDDFYANVFPLLKKYNFKATQYVIYDYIDEKGFLSKKQIRELIDSGLVEIGSHTLDHVWLKTTDDKEAKKQVVDSKKKFEKAFNIKVDTFCYPAGGYDERILHYVQEAGYTAAYSIIAGVYQDKSNLNLVKRIRTAAYGDSLLQTLEDYRYAGK